MRPPAECGRSLRLLSTTVSLLWIGGVDVQLLDPRVDYDGRSYYRMTTAHRQIGVSRCGSGFLVPF